jgi:hypothetical protein
MPIFELIPCQHFANLTPLVPLSLRRRGGRKLEEGLALLDAYMSKRRA